MRDYGMMHAMADFAATMMFPQPALCRGQSSKASEYRHSHCQYSTAWIARDVSHTQEADGNAAPGSSTLIRVSETGGSTLGRRQLFPYRYASERGDTISNNMVR